LSPIFRKNKDVIARQIAGETLLVPIRGDLAGMQRLFALDKVGEYVWQLLDNPTDGETMVDSVVANFGVDREQAQADIQEFVAELLAAGLIVEVS
jgi:hypothetical protein